MALLVATGLVACSGGGGAGGMDMPGDPGPTIEAGFAKGLVLDGGGRPVAGAKVVVGSTVYYNANIIGTTDASGRYRLRLTPDDSWRAYASISRTFEGQIYTLDLHPEPSNTFTSADGGIQNFEWKLTGEKSGGKHGTYGAAVLATPVDDTFETDTKAQYVQLTLEPVGALIDGSAGRIITAMVQPSSNGTGVFDVPIGRYRATAKYVLPGQPAVDMLVSSESSEEWSSEYTGVFVPARSGASNTYEIRLQVKLPADQRAVN